MQWFGTQMSEQMNGQIWKLGESELTFTVERFWSFWTIKIMFHSIHSDIHV